MGESRLSSIEHMEEFIFLSGEAVFTLRSKATGKRYTYRVSRKLNQDLERERPIWWVELLTGRDNTRDFTKLGKLTTDSTDLLVYRVRGGPRGAPAKGMAWLIDCIVEEDFFRFAMQAEMWVSDSCRSCGARLTTPESLSQGLGPCCGGRE